MPTAGTPSDAVLLAWYEENRRPLPWRETNDPYAILVSEVMAQQNPLRDSGVMETPA
jgi:A/G-specific adenine glycosylase